MNDTEAVWVVSGTLVFVGMIAQLAGKDGTPGIVVGVLAPLVMIFLMRVETLKQQRQSDKDYYERLQERLNALEVWREETLTDPEGLGMRLDAVCNTLDFHDDRITNLERRKTMLEYVKLSSFLPPLAVAFVITVIYFISRQGDRHDEQ